MTLLYCGLSDIGLQRSNNEDVWAALPEHHFFALADGMGGHNGGEVAAALAVTSLCDSVRQISKEERTEWTLELHQAIQKANQKIYELSRRETSLSGMGTTLCTLLWTPQKIIYAHVGDSRIYRRREGKLELLTEDHSFYTKWKRLGSETPYPYKHVITRAVGSTAKVKPTIAYADHRPGDLYLLCTDGLSDMLSLQEIEKGLKVHSDLFKNAEFLIDSAKQRGGSDNITLLLVQIP
ncbi:MAG: serine/threonine-protein phosphatase [Verrucomicrobiota bacterium]|nr:serine/threonine-protein phosphatase [Verrucomicrobiota bacterium]